ncbi:hypothetical protein GOP47_0015292 [Adiantum capillus-veneris]|uniref:non-specific serine/threonine protein kinase n=1 Tax=Adiantum capillus-veneris TaxID=13818 RepID=A0A9D4UJF2_ADICA|nr:hypothetical protein GOP47_0015292 [Adiantum capillus-veneris]
MDRLYTHPNTSLHAHLIIPLAVCCLLLLHSWTPIFADNVQAPNGPQTNGGDGGFGEPLQSPALAPSVYYRDKDALITLKGLLGKENPFISSVLYNWGGRDDQDENEQEEEEDICQWARVHCDDSSNVMFLDFRQLNLQGPLPQHAFSSFPSLTRLSLSSNNFSAGIPTDIALCANLQTLDLSYNSLSSNIPVELGFLQNLTQLDLSSNQLRGQIDLGMAQNWTSLFYLNLSNNEFSGSMPYVNSQSLRLLDLSNNQFNGSLPLQPLGEVMPNLQGLRLGGNKLFGEIPSSLFNTCSTTLQELDLSWNAFWGSLPSTVGNCSALRILSLSRNYLGGYLPGEIGDLLQLKSLILGDNHFSSLASELGSLTNLIYLDLKRNHLSGKIPSFLALNKGLQYLWLNSNNLSGTIPPEVLQNLTLVKYLDLSNNALDGGIPRELKNMTSLRYLLMSGNGFAGKIPEEIGNFKSLQVLDLSFNALNGSIPSSIGGLQSLLWLMLSSNSLTGPLPQEITNCSSLLWLNAANNHLSGPLPDRLGMMGNQARITLDENEATFAPLPDNAGDCSFMERWLPTDEGFNYNIYFSVLDYRACAAIWNRFIMGRLPLGGSSCQSKVNFTTSAYLQLSNNKLSGSIPDSLGNFSMLSFLFLGSNKLTGSIPLILTTLPLLNLDLSHNELNGSISPSLGNLTCLAMLDLSSNHLSGNIPAGLENLGHLYNFNVSFNADLTGPIPKGGRFPGFQSSAYLGNQKLCFADDVVRQQVVGGPSAKCPSNDTQARGGTGALGDRQHQHEHGASVKKYMKAGALAGVVAAGALLVVGAVGMFVNFAAARQKLANRGAGGSELHSLMDYHKSAASEKWTAEMFDGRRRGWLSYADLDWATCGFNDKFLAGRGSSAAVYKANLGGGVVLAVKLLEFHVSNRESFLTHVRHVASLRHPNLVPVIGCLSRGAQHLLLLPFIQRGSLHDILRMCPHLLDWQRTLHVVHGVAAALAYLHGICKPPVVHGDLKPSNILIDGLFKPYLADCALAHAIPVGMQPWHAPVHSEFVAPEYAPALEPTAQGDVYSFGAIMLELVTRQRGNAGHVGGVVKWARAAAGRRSATEVVDVQLWSTCADVRHVAHFVRLALACTHDDPSCRPAMHDLVTALAVLASEEEHRLPCIYTASV